MGGRHAARLVLLGFAVALAGWSLIWGAGQALADSADLHRRVEEIRLFLKRVDPYQDPDLTYPPSALPVFALLLGPIPAGLEPAAWLLANLAALVALIVGLGVFWSRRLDRIEWVLLACWVAAVRPTRAGLALGQFHLIPTALAVWTIPALAAGRQGLAGVLLGLSLTKPTMAAPLWLFWVARGHCQAALVALSVQGALLVLASIWLARTPWELTAEFLANARGQSAAGSLDIPSLLSRSGVPETGAVLAGGLLLVIACVAAGRTRRARDVPATGAGAGVRRDRHLSPPLRPGPPRAAGGRSICRGRPGPPSRPGDRTAPDRSDAPAVDPPARARA